MSINRAFAKLITDNLGIIQDIKVALLHLQESPDDIDVARTISYATQAIKGMDNFNGTKHIIAFAYIFENVLSRIRKAELPPEANLVALLISCCDLLSSMLIQLDTNDEIYLGHHKRSLGLIGQLHKHKDSAKPILLDLNWLTRQFGGEF